MTNRDPWFIDPEYEEQLRWDREEGQDIRDEKRIRDWEVERDERFLHE
jgi:hypothetical protein